MLRVTLASTRPIPDELVERCHPQRLVETRPTFGHAVHAFTEHDSPATLRADLRAAAGGVAVGVVSGDLVEHDARLLLSDVDSTLTTTEAVDLLAEHAGRRDEVAAITERAMRGELDFEASLRARVATLEGLPTSVFDEVAPRMTLSPGALDLIAWARARGALVGVTSGGFTQLVEPLAKSLGLDYHAANELATTRRDGREVLTGEIVGDVVDRAHKERDLRRFAASADVPLGLAAAVGDGANDLAMLAAAGLGIAYCAKPAAAAEADVHVAFPRLDAVGAFAFPQG